MSVCRRTPFVGICRKGNCLKIVKKGPIIIVFGLIATSRYLHSIYMVFQFVTAKSTIIQTHIRHSQTLASFFSSHSLYTRNLRSSLDSSNISIAPTRIHPLHPFPSFRNESTMPRRKYRTNINTLNFVLYQYIGQHIGRSPLYEFAHYLKCQRWRNASVIETIYKQTESQRNHFR
jgi:hypothetical protein